ncbi:hypothetical protein C8R47DRAFT_1294963 [Mycena vitilis]|nr:hypothetical protein C8R47DRAFT_1294963 [Mycena vitilis]
MILPTPSLLFSRPKHPLILLQIISRSTMFLLVDGTSARTVTFQHIPQTTLSAAFHASLRGLPGTALLVTTTITGFLPSSSLIRCNVVLDLGFDVVLGLDWAAYLRDSLINLGYRLESSFDAWNFYSTSGNLTAQVLPHSRNTSVMSPTPVNSRDHAGGPYHCHSELNSETINSETLNPIKFVKRDTAVKRGPGQSVKRPRKKRYVVPSTSGEASAVDSGTTFLRYVPPEDIQSPSPQVSGSSKPPPPKISVERRGVDALDRLLLSPQQCFNLFTMSAASLTKLMTMHHIERPTEFSLNNARHAILTHLITGSCLTSEDRLPDLHVDALGSCLGLADKSRLNVDLHLGRKRRRLVEDESSVHSVDTIFDKFETLTRGPLLALAQSHGIRLKDTATRDQLRYAISHHLSTGSCTSREGYTSYLACSSVESQLEPFTTQPGTAEDPATCLQIHLIRQIAPKLQLRPLRRLLDLHDVSYVC